MALTLHSIPFDRVRVTLRLRTAVRFHFLHGGVLQGLLRHALASHDIPNRLLFHTPENGRTEFEAGDPYAFSLTFANDLSAGAPQLLQRIAAIGRTAPATERPILGGNFDVESVTPLPPVDLDRQLDAARAAETLTLRFVSPLRLERPEELKTRGAGFLNDHCFPAAHFLDRLWRRLFLLHTGAFPTPHDLVAMPSLDTAIATDPSSLLWIDLPIRGIAGSRPDRPTGMTLGGVLGAVRLHGVPRDWLASLIIGQYLHAGEKTAFGLGRYVIEECGTLWDDALRPARSLLSTAADPSRLRRAHEHVDEHSDAAGIDGITPESFPLSQIDDISARLTDGTWDPPDLLGFLAAKRDGGVRALAIPTVADRIAQRAACNVLAPSIDTLLEDCSYAYRKGFSRAGAARAVERAWDDGFRWVLDADIASFFDAVDWPRLFAKLHALYPVEPLLPLIERWVSAPVVYEGKRIERRRGLPQGSPLAPLLANLFLDELDEEILGRDYRLLRYADDFVVLCRDADGAKAAKEDVERALAGLGLELNESKTGIRSLEAGLTWLGYLFCRSVVADAAPEAANDAESAAIKIPDGSWLAHVPLDQIRPLARQRPSQSEPETVRLARDSAPAAAEESPLYVLQPGARLWLHESRIVIKAGEDDEVSRPLRSVSHLVCFTGAHPTIPLLLELSREKKPVYFCGHDGAIEAALSPWDPDWTLWSAQLAMANDPERVLPFVRNLVQAKLHNAAILGRRLGAAGSEQSLAEMRELERQADNKTEVDSLRGLEGRGAVLFFDALRAVIPAEWAFTTRERHPAPDPVNAMLSFAYTILYNHAATAIVAAGLNPRIGLFHQGRGTWQALASDLSEELRHLAESFVVSMIRRKEIKPDDFVRTHGGKGVLLRYPARREFIRRFEERLLTSFTPPAGERPTTYLEFLARQAAQLRAVITGAKDDYEPLRIRA